MGLVFRSPNRKLLPAPAFGGRLAIDWSHPLCNGLSYIRVFNNGGNVHPLFNASGYDGAYSVSTGSPTIGIAQGGVGLTGLGGIQYGAGGTSNYVIPLTKGTCVAQVSAGFSPTDGLTHIALFSDIPTFAIFKNSDNRWYAGWNTSLDYRVSVAASGTFNAGDTFSAALTWDTSANSKLYIKGLLQATNATPPVTASSAGSTLNIADNGGGAARWNTSAQDAIHYVVFWSRVLSADELALLDADPYCFFMPAEGEMPALFVAAAGGSFIPAWAMNSNLPVIGTGTY